GLLAADKYEFRSLHKSRWTKVQLKNRIAWLKKELRRLRTCVEPEPCDAIRVGGRTHPIPAIIRKRQEQLATYQEFLAENSARFKEEAKYTYNVKRRRARQRAKQAESKARLAANKADFQRAKRGLPPLRSGT